MSAFRLVSSLASSITNSTLRLPLLVLVGCVLLLIPTASNAQQALGAPISGSLGDAVYSENNQSGPSSSLFMGSRSLQTPYLHVGVSDPLGFLIESGAMSPFFGVDGQAFSYPEAGVQTGVIPDSTLTERFSEYRDNHLLMGGTGGGSTLTGHAVAAGGMVSRGSGAMAPGAAAGGFSGATMRSPFAAGSLATRQTGAGGASGFLDPNLLVALATSSSVLDSGQGASVPGAGSTIYSTDESGTATGTFATTGVPESIVVTPVGDPVAGPAPGELFPDVTMVMPSATGFPDSTMGTAGAPFEAPDTAPSPLLSSTANSVASSPFRALNTPSISFLEPSLLGISGGPPGSPLGTGGGSSGVSYSEIRRKARLHAMIYNPNAVLPTPFEQRAMERDFKKAQSGRHVPHKPKLTSQSEAERR